MKKSVPGNSSDAAFKYQFKKCVHSLCFYRLLEHKRELLCWEVGRFHELNLSDCCPDLHVWVYAGQCLYSCNKKHANWQTRIWNASICTKFSPVEDIFFAAVCFISLSLFIFNAVKKPDYPQKSESTFAWSAQVCACVCVPMWEAGNKSSQLPSPLLLISSFLLHKRAELLLSVDVSHIFTLSSLCCLFCTCSQCCIHRRAGKTRFLLILCPNFRNRFDTKYQSVVWPQNREKDVKHMMSVFHLCCFHALLLGKMCFHHWSTQICSFHLPVLRVIVSLPYCRHAQQRLQVSCLAKLYYS